MTRKRVKKAVSAPQPIEIGSPIRGCLDEATRRPTQPRTLFRFRREKAASAKIDFRRGGDTSAEDEDGKKGGR